MNHHKERLVEAIRQIASEEIITHLEFSPHQFGVVSILEIILSKDGNYADIIVSSSEQKELLPKALAPLAFRIHGRISRELEIRKTPQMRFRSKKSGAKDSIDILSLINTLDKQYGLSEEHPTAHSS
jgi:ribosome-binding factor A